ncbi:MAG: hypothetical protein IT200_04205 [Thermoleophilia bacterium]|nr:hypothetical protein [Thermoleophilia bacterium]
MNGLTDAGESALSAGPALDLPAELQAINKAYVSSSAFADLLTRATQLASDFDELMSLAQVGRSTQDALKLAAREVQFGGVLARAGMFRPAFGSLRLALEVGSWGIFLSTDEMASRRWLTNLQDVSWSMAVAGERGVLTTQFANVFFPELAEHVDDYHGRATSLYRTLSGFVHGEVRTHALAGTIAYSEESLSQVRVAIGDVGELLLFMFLLRYASDIHSLTSAAEAALQNALGHLSPVREWLEAKDRN